MNKSRHTERVSSLLEDLIQKMAAESPLLELSRNDYLIRAGMIEHHLYFIESGAVRVIYQTEIEEHTIRLGYKGSIITALDSFLSKAPTEFYIQALRKTTYRAITRTDFNEFVQSSPTRVVQYNDLLRVFVIEQIEREQDLLTDSPVDRLARVERRSPMLFQEVPLRYIACYLRMSPETLSRIRKS